ncbi:hypothetical protein BT69DRAFT_966715 [Atractiella rhizophila]|nr:hypothetical protein BT69DRAFT_966715 [Atractiella rhizophila]
MPPSPSTKKPPLRRLSIPLQATSSAAIALGTDDDVPLSAGAGARGGESGETTPVGRRRKKMPFEAGAASGNVGSAASGQANGSGNANGVYGSGYAGSYLPPSTSAQQISKLGWVNGSSTSTSTTSSSRLSEPSLAPSSSSRTSTDIREESWFPSPLHSPPSHSHSQNSSYFHTPRHSNTLSATDPHSPSPLHLPLTPPADVRSFKMNVPREEGWGSYLRRGVKRLRLAAASSLGGGGGGGGPGERVLHRGGGGGGGGAGGGGIGKGKGRLMLMGRIQLCTLLFVFITLFYLFRSPSSPSPSLPDLPQTIAPILVPPPRTPRRNSPPPRSITSPSLESTNRGLNYTTLTSSPSYFSLPMDQINLGVLISSPLSTSSQTSILVSKLRKQSLLPKRVLVVCRDGEGEDVALALENEPGSGSGAGEEEGEEMELQVATFGDEIDSRNEALVRAGVRYLGGTNVLLILGGGDVLPDGNGWLEHFVRSLNVPQLGGRWIGSTGWDREGACWDDPRSVGAKEVVVPRGPFVVLTEWIQHLAPFKYPVQLRTSLIPGREEHVGEFLALALRRYVGVEGAAVPLAEREGVDEEYDAEEEEGEKCEGERKPIVLRELVRAGVGREESKREGRRGSVVFFASDDDEGRTWEPIACQFRKRGHEVLLFLASSEELEDASSLHGAGTSTYDSTHLCALDVRLLSSPVLETLTTIGGTDVAFYLLGSDHEQRWERALRAWGGWFGEKARRWGSGAGGGGEGRTTVIALGKEEAGGAEWIGSLPLEGVLEWHTPQIDLAVITDNRPSSLTRLLRALQTSYYLGDQVSLTINLEQTADRVTQDLVHGLDWPHGKVTVRHRIVKAGLMPAIVESWYPSSNHSYGIILEDDVEVSPLFYSWVKFAILNYRYGTAEERRRSRRMYGVSLYQQKNIELRPERREDFDAHQLFGDLMMHPYTPYLSQIPCSWGAVYFPEVWREFHMYLALRLSEVAIDISDIVVPDIRSNRWAKSWKKYFIEMVYLRGYTMLYPNYKDFKSFSTNHLEKGTHIHSTVQTDKAKGQFIVPLMEGDASLLDGLPDSRMPDWKDSPFLDLWGTLVNEEEILQRGYNGIEAIGSCPTQEVTGGSLSMIGGKKTDVVEREELKERETTFNARELLCERKHRTVDFMDVVAQ